MPSHTFTRLGYWQESIDSNVAAAAAARRQGQTAEELHASDYGTYAYLQTGQDEAAARIVKSLPEMASRFDPKAVLIGAGPPSAGYFALAAIPARYALERQDWQQAKRLAQSETPFPYADAVTWFARGLGVQFETTLRKEPRRLRSLYGAAHAAQLSGSSDLSLRYFGELLTVCAPSDKPGRPEITEAREALAKQKS
jgi:hypothetical protein